MTNQGNGEGQEPLWRDDPWVAFAAQAGDEFCRNHMEDMPGNLDDVWDLNELEYFLFAFIPWIARTTYQPKAGNAAFEARCREYRRNVWKSMQPTGTKGGGEGREMSDFTVYAEREAEYTDLLRSGCSDPVRLLNASGFAPACEAFVHHACKRHFVSQSDLVCTITS